MRNIILIGLPGSGKTTLGAKAAQILNLDFLDLDQEIERRAGLSVPEIFHRLGEDHFRDLEAQAVRSISGQGRLIATGGGVVVRDGNIEALKRGSYVIFIDRPVDKIWATCPRDDSRPLLQGNPSRLGQLSKERRALYISAADIRLPNQGDEEEALKWLLAAIRAESVAEGYAVIGDPIVHSLSPVIHEAVFKRLGFDSSYQAIQVPQSGLPSFMKRVAQSNIKGFNVTLPHKQAIMPLLDEIDTEAALCGSVNTVVNSRGRLVGFNTDMDGLWAALKDHGGDFFGRKVLILGAGGSAGSIACKAARSGADEIVILARRLEQAEEAAERAERHFASKIKTGFLSPESTAEAAQSANLLINCTPLGMQGFEDDFQSLDFLDRLPSAAVVCDLIYKPLKTSLIQAAEKRELAALNGLGMLIHQAILADEYFLNQQLNRSDLYQAAASALKQFEK